MNNKAKGILLPTILLLLGDFSGCRKYPILGKSPPKWEVGQWVRYKTTSSPASIEFSLVGKETGDENETLFWLEIYEDYLDTPVILKLLVREGLKERPKRIFLQNGKGPVAEVTEIQLFLEEIWKESLVPKEEGQVKESLALPIGVLETLLYKIESEEGHVRIWTQENIPIWGIAKVSREGMELVVSDFGLSGAMPRMKEGPWVAQTLAPK